MNSSSAPREASSDNDERGRLTEESQAPASPRFGRQTRPVEQSKVPLTSTRSLRPRPNAESTRFERLPAVSVVIPTRRTEFVASTKTNAPTRARRYGNRSGSDSSNLKKDRSSPKARGCSRKRPKRAMENTSASTNDIVGKCTGQSQLPSDGSFSSHPG